MWFILFNIIGCHVLTCLLGIAVKEKKEGKQRGTKLTEMWFAQFEQRHTDKGVQWNDVAKCNVFLPSNITK